jgi:ribosomal protein S27AE
MSTSKLHTRRHGRAPDLRDAVIRRECASCPPGTTLRFDVDGAYCPKCGTLYPMKADNRSAPC